MWTSVSPWSAAERVFRVAVAASSEVPGAWVADVSELSYHEAALVATVHVENRSGVTVHFRQRGAPRHPAGDQQVDPYATVGRCRLTVSIPVLKAPKFHRLKL
jgi:hypothetical protein